MRDRRTLTESSLERPEGAPPRPGLLLGYFGQRALALALPLEGELVLGRDTFEALGLRDERMSREHVRVWPGRAGLRVEDLGSRNGTFVDGERVTGPIERIVRTLRIGRSVLLPVADVGAFERAPLQRKDGLVVGPALAAAWAEIAALSRSATSLLILGESGAGKEAAARVYHQASAHASGPFVAVNCAAIPAGLAERVLFGARKGAYSGATADSEGHAQAADGGTLFLDELGELDPAVQPKLLRLLESSEVQPLGAASPQRITLSVCAATHRNLRQDVKSGRFRPDLYYRIARPVVRLPPLRERLEEIPWLVWSTLEPLGGAASPTFVEQCVLRPWPGNARELVAEVQRAFHLARAEGRTELDASDLDEEAGQRIDDEPEAARAAALDDAEVVRAALREHSGNVTSAARALGVHRNQLRRWIARQGFDPRAPG